MGMGMEEERKKREERKISTGSQGNRISGEALRKLSSENGRKISQEMMRKLSGEQNERKMSNGLMTNGPVSVGKGPPT